MRAADLSNGPRAARARCLRTRQQRRSSRGGGRRGSAADQGEVAVGSGWGRGQRQRPRIRSDRPKVSKPTVGGHGLRIVAAISESWGVVRRRGGCTVWSEVHVEDAARVAENEVAAAYVRELAAPSRPGRAEGDEPAVHLCRCPNCGGIACSAANAATVGPCQHCTEPRAPASESVPDHTGASTLYSTRSGARARDRPLSRRLMTERAAGPFMARMRIPATTGDRRQVPAWRPSCAGRLICVAPLRGGRLCDRRRLSVRASVLGRAGWQEACVPLRSCPPRACASAPCEAWRGSSGRR